VALARSVRLGRHRRGGKKGSACQGARPRQLERGKKTGRLVSKSNEKKISDQVRIKGHEFSDSEAAARYCEWRSVRPTSAGICKNPQGRTQGTGAPRRRAEPFAFRDWTKPKSVQAWHVNRKIHILNGGRSGGFVKPSLADSGMDLSVRLFVMEFSRIKEGQIKPQDSSWS